LVEEMEKVKEQVTQKQEVSPQKDNLHFKVQSLSTDVDTLRD